jgi:hypothetical protein
MGGIGMDWQQPAALALVAATAIVMLYVRVRRVRRRTSHSCSPGCRCPALEFRPGKMYLESLPNRPEKPQ